MPKSILLLATMAATAGTLLLLVSCSGAHRATTGDKSGSAAATAERPWRTLPLIANAKVDPAWVHTGFGTLAVDDDALRTDCDTRGMGLLVYTTEKFGDCQIRVVYRGKDPRANSGVYIRIDDGILHAIDDQPLPATRRPDGKLTDDGLKAMQAASEQELGPWYAVHHGYEVQIQDEADAFHRTGAIYSLTKAEPAPSLKMKDAWRTMIITLAGEKVTVDVDGKRVSSFDATVGDVPERKEWYEPKREPKRSTQGYIGLQNHDPGDVVWFKEVSVRPL
jgi:hypothetical protein